MFHRDSQQCSSCTAGRPSTLLPIANCVDRYIKELSKFHLREIRRLTGSDSQDLLRTIDATRFARFELPYGFKYFFGLWRNFFFNCHHRMLF